MGERKVLNKYYPPDFDPAKISRRRRRRRRPQNHQLNVRMMLPMSVRCATCANYIYEGTKFNSRKENVVGETYLGIQMFRFYMKCTKCSAEIIFRTDPKNSDYAVESGATRNFEPWRAEDEETRREKRKRDAEEIGDSMKSLENTKRLMDIVAALDELKSIKSRQVSVDTILEALKRMNEEKSNKLEEEDASMIKSLYRGLKEQHVIRIYSDDDFVLGASNMNSKRQKTNGDVTEKLTESLTTSNCLDSSGKAGGSGASKDCKFLFKSSMVTISVLNRRPSDSSVCKSVEEGKKKPDQMEQYTAVSGCGLQSLCQQYGSEEED